MNSLNNKPDDASFQLNDNRGGKAEIRGGKNIIFYGVPGSGKSYSIKRKIGELLPEPIHNDAELDKMYGKLSGKDNIVRVVFHPDYTYSDFTGQILPKTVGTDVMYEFKPGPFTNILKAAIKRPNEPFFLIIEEINRGNAASIFGDLFQLLDRKNNESEYKINNHEIQEEVYGIGYTPDQKVFIPPNLWLFATMNTSDQNVFTLDTAFQRRWEMELIPNDFDVRQEFPIEGTGGVTWRVFAEKVNEELEKGNEMMSGDKRLGAWFIQPDDGQDFVSKDRFANKVLKYLWDDAFKFNRRDFFKMDNDKTLTLEKVIKTFKDDGQSLGKLLKIQFDSK